MIHDIEFLHVSSSGNPKHKVVQVPTQRSWYYNITAIPPPLYFGFPENGASELKHVGILHIMHGFSLLMCICWL